VISIIVGDDYENAASSQNIKLAEIPWEFHPPRRQRDSAIEVTYEYDTERIFTLQIHDIYTGQKRRFAIQQVSQN
jgi:molecular chaperone DnaK (HSP70)